MKLSIESILWNNIFRAIQTELFRDPNFISKCKLIGATSVYEEEFAKRGIYVTLAIFNNSFDSEFGPKWISVEIFDQTIYTELALKYL